MTNDREPALRDIVEASGRYTEFDEPAGIASSIPISESRCRPPRGNAFTTALICAALAGSFYLALYAVISVL